MPIFGLAWVASWVGCFFSSSQDLLKAPNYPPCVLSIEPVTSSRSAQTQVYRLITGEQVAMAALVPPSARRGKISSQPTVDHNQRTSSGFPPQMVTPARGALFNLLPYQIAQPALKAGSIFGLPALLQTLKGVFATRTAPALPAQSAIATPKRSSRVIFNSKSAQAEPKPSDRCQAESGIKGRKQPLFAVRFREQVVGSVANEQQALSIARRLEQALTQPGLEPEELRPGVLNGQPVVQLGDLPIVALDPNLLENRGCDSTAVATRWVNRLKQVLAETPPTLAEVQERMLGLQETEQTIAGMASWYGPYFHGRQTATGEIFDENELTAAHPSLPFDTYLKVTNLTNGKSVIVRVNDRGPYFDNRTLDLSREAARQLGSEEVGVVPIEAVIMEPVSTSATPSRFARL